jgi:hypothetical protein
VALEVGVGLCAGAVLAKAKKRKGKREEAGKPEKQLLNIDLHNTEFAALAFCTLPYTGGNSAKSGSFFRVPRLRASIAPLNS